MTRQPRPSARATTIDDLNGRSWSRCTKATSFPSGDQSGADHTHLDPRSAITRSPDPSALATTTSGLAREANAKRLPSGDHAGPQTLNPTPRDETRYGSLPSEFATKTPVFPAP
jgi:hypothetical protein